MAVGFRGLGHRKEDGRGQGEFFADAGVVPRQWGVHLCLEPCSLQQKPRLTV